MILVGTLLYVDPDPGCQKIRIHNTAYVTCRSSSLSSGSAALLELAASLCSNRVNVAELLDGLSYNTVEDH